MPMKLIEVGAITVVVTVYLFVITVGGSYNCLIASLIITAGDSYNRRVADCNCQQQLKLLIRAL